jgi:beta-barrel assembly-enhancing protease
MIRIFNLFLILVSLTFYNQVKAQKNSRIINNGPIPTEFITAAKSRYEGAKSTIEKNEKAAVKKAKNRFYLESNYQLDYILKSGKVVFNEEIFNYLNKVLDILIKAQPELQGKIKLYPIKLDNANAFTFNEGYIFVNIGLLARLNNEAELAFILGHEINHYTNQHSIKRQLKKLQIKDQDNRFKLSRYSRINEFEADKEGYELFAKTAYDKNAAVTALEMLFISNQPYAERKFNFDFFEKGSLFIPQIDSSNKVKSAAKQFDLEISEEEADSLATHPALEDRIREIKTLSDKASKGGLLFIASNEEQFLKIQQICRIEMARMFMIDKDYQKAFYHLYLLKKDYPNNQEIDLLHAILWGKLSFDLENKSIKEVMPAPVLKNNTYQNGIIEEEEYLRRVISGFNREEIQLIAIKNIYLASKANPQLVSLKTLCSKIIQSYRGNFGRSVSDFETIDNFSKENVFKLYLVKDTPEQTEKSARIKKAKAKKRKFDFDNSFAKFALSDLFANDEEFKKLFNSFKAGKAALNKEDENSEDDPEKEITSNIKEKNKKKIKPKAPDNLGVDRMILLEPQYSKKDFRKKEPIDLVGNEATQLELINTLTTAGKAAGMEVICLTPNIIESNEIEKFNDMALLKSWLSESLQNDKGYSPSVYGDELLELKKKYDARYVTILFTRSLIRSKKGTGARFGSVVGLLVHPILFVSMLVNGYMPDKSMDLIIGVVDLEENKLIYAHEYNYNLVDSEDLLKSQMYYIFKTMTK